MRSETKSRTGASTAVGGEEIIRQIFIKDAARRAFNANYIFARSPIGRERERDDLAERHCAVTVSTP